MSEMLERMYRENVVCRHTRQEEMTRTERTALLHAQFAPVIAAASASVNQMHVAIRSIPAILEAIRAGQPLHHTDVEENGATPIYSATTPIHSATTPIPRTSAKTPISPVNLRLQRDHLDLLQQLKQYDLTICHPGAKLEENDTIAYKLDDKNKGGWWAAEVTGYSPDDTQGHIVYLHDEVMDTVDLSDKFYCKDITKNAERYSWVLLRSIPLSQTPEEVRKSALPPLNKRGPGRPQYNRKKPRGGPTSGRAHT